MRRHYYKPGAHYVSIRRRRGGDGMMSGSDARQGRMAARAFVFGPGEGHTVPGAGGITLKATSEQTGGSVGFLEASTEPGGGPAPHTHRDCDELFYVLEGEFRFLVGDNAVIAPAGSFVFVPRGTVHAARIIGAQAERVLAAYVLGGQEGAFEAFAGASAGERDGVAEGYHSEFAEDLP